MTGTDIVLITLRSLHSSLIEDLIVVHTDFISLTSHGTLMVFLNSQAPWNHWFFWLTVAHH